MIYKYIEYINEGRGISNTIKYYVSILEKYINGQNTNIFLDFDDKSLKLKNININISYNKKEEYEGIFNPEFFSFKDDNLCDIILNISIPKNYDIVRVRSLFSHELTHILEFFNLIKNKKDIPKHGKMKINLEKFKKKHEYENYFDAFLHYLYLTLDNEFNARVSELYFYLKSKNTKDELELEQHIKNSYIWKKIEEIEIFDSVRFTDFLIKRVGELSTIIFINTFNNSLENDLKIDININNIEDVYFYFKIWEKKFKIKNKKHKEKCLKIKYEI
jgi:hypothetical protein